MPDFTPGSTGTDEVLFARDGVLGRVLLNRPRAINSLTRDMVVAVRTQLTQWQEDDAITAVSIEGAGEKGLCAGGDVRAVREAHLAGSSGGVDFWADEYVLDAQIAEYPKPVIAVMDGIVMGGGLGISMFADARWATERSRIAMPETIIGFFPDVAATYLLSRTPGELGTHMAMTGATVGGADAVDAGLADCVVDSASIPDLLAAVAAGGPVEAVPGAGAEGGVPASATQGTLAAARGWIDECYAGNDPAVILERLRGHADPAAQAAAEEISVRSPLSVAVTLEAVRRAADAESVREVLRTDTVVSANLLHRPDFSEGVRGLLVDKDKQPRWEHPDLASVPRSEVLELFTQ
ncbi:enoyl-CoA hydratase/isomerase family protein [Janibacter cremeus]|uniref:enoyl-CoA hydratase/isomerase family protein n=1 Tax=Janibacter cremeus TaxID=1285192 RepID=UPI0023F91BEA|nr:enoyl-CoA hydratase/isomerase family protein [Janibacter cremeus]WEV76904.1 enoyl-CoA hydratase/isomerase family protein [Janibacter cremeus]